MEGDHGKGKRPSFKKILLVTLLVVAFLIAAMFIALYFYMKTQYFGKSNYVKNQGYTINRDIQRETYVDEEGNVQAETEARLDSEEEASVIAVQEEVLQGLTSEDKQDTKTYNLLLIGVDRKDDSRYGNSDVMMLMTVNPEKETVFLTSFLRDLYANIPEVGVRKLNASCAYGGAELCVETIRSNYGVEIDNYAMVDVHTMTSVINVLGGIELEADSLDTLTLTSLIQEVLPYVTHDIDQGTLLKLISKLPEWLNYSLEQQHIPYDDMYHSENEILIPDMEATITQLRETIY